MKFSYLVIAGPQAAGKTTLINHICNQNKDKVFQLPETRAIVNNKYRFGGAISMTALDEINVWWLDNERMFNKRQELSDNPNRVYVDESNIFSLAHASMHGIQTTSAFKDYCSLLKKLNSYIIFLDNSPEISWKRREKVYKKRVNQLPFREQESMLREYKGYMEKVYPELKKLYEKIELPKICIPSFDSLQEFLSFALKKIPIPNYN